MTKSPHFNLKSIMVDAGEVIPGIDNWAIVQLLPLYSTVYDYQYLKLTDTYALKKSD